MKQVHTALLAACLIAGCSACSSTRPSSVDSIDRQLGSNGSSFLQSGTIVISRQMPVPSSAPIAGEQEHSGRPLTPIVGYFPPTSGFLPSENEAWVQIDTIRKVIEIFRGQTMVKEMRGEGNISLAPGQYTLQVKQKRPLWYAPDDYFTRRKMQIPPAGDRSRYLRGALGGFVLYPTTTFPIHCGPVWTDDVGGLRVSRGDLSAIYYMLPVGSPVIVK